MSRLGGSLRWALFVRWTSIWSVSYLGCAAGGRWTAGHRRRSCSVLKPLGHLGGVRLVLGPRCLGRLRDLEGRREELAVRRTDRAHGRGARAMWYIWCRYYRGSGRVGRYPAGAWRLQYSPRRKIVSPDGRRNCRRRFVIPSPRPVIRPWIRLACIQLMPLLLLLNPVRLVGSSWC